MEVINQTSEWFKTDEAISMYNSLESLADKTVFLYSYLSKIADKSFRENKTLFKMAFLLADAISKSNLPYNEYEVLIDPNINPFITYLKTSKEYIGELETFVILNAILENKVDVKDKSAWIYNADFFDDDNEYLDKLEEMGCCFLPNPSYYVVNPAKFEIEENLQMAMLEIYWLFGMPNDTDEEE